MTKEKWAALNIGFLASVATAIAGQAVGLDFGLHVFFTGLAGFAATSLWMSR